MTASSTFNNLIRRNSTRLNRFGVNESSSSVSLTSTSLFLSSTPITKLTKEAASDNLHRLKRNRDSRRTFSQQCTTTINIPPTSQAVDSTREQVCEQGSNVTDRIGIPRGIVINNSTPISTFSYSNNSSCSSAASVGGVINNINFSNKKKLPSYTTLNRNASTVASPKKLLNDRSTLGLFFSDTTTAGSNHTVSSSSSAESSKSSTTTGILPTAAINKKTLTNAYGSSSSGSKESVATSDDMFDMFLSNFYDSSSSDSNSFHHGSIGTIKTSNIDACDHASIVQKSNTNINASADDTILTTTNMSANINNKSSSSSSASSFTNNGHSSASVSRIDACLGSCAHSVIHHDSRYCYSLPPAIDKQTNKLTTNFPISSLSNKTITTGVRNPERSRPRSPQKSTTSRSLSPGSNATTNGTYPTRMMAPKSRNLRTTMSQFSTSSGGVTDEKSGNLDGDRGGDSESLRGAESESNADESSAATAASVNDSGSSSLTNDANEDEDDDSDYMMSTRGGENLRNKASSSSVTDHLGADNNNDCFGDGHPVLKRKKSLLAVRKRKIKFNKTTTPETK